MTPTVAVLSRLAGPTDAALLASFTATRDDAAFAELVRRHGPAVLAVCRRLTRHAQDAEDAFQAAFLVLARKAERVREPAAAWLYGVAVRAARNAAARAWRRRGREEPLDADVPAPPAEPFEPDAAAAVLDEVSRLPAFLRSAVILCELEGRSRSSAARELGVAEGTLSSRLAAARKRLADRLAARGFGPAVLAMLAPAVVPHWLTAAVLTADRVSPAVATLARGVLPIMDVRRLALAPILAAVVAAAGFALPPTPGARPEPPPPPAPVLSKGPNQLFFCWGESFFRCDPDGRNGRPVRLPACPKPHPDWWALSPDGTRVAVVPDPPDRQGRGFRLLVLATNGTGPTTDLGDGLAAPDVIWSGDGTRLYVTTTAPPGRPKPPGESHAVVEVASGRRTPLPIPPEYSVSDWSRDGERWLASRLVVERWDDLGSRRLFVLARDGTPLREVGPPANTEADGGRFSPDGRRVLYAARPRPSAAGRVAVMVFDLNTGRSTPVAGIPPVGRVYGACWSPDGRRIAYTWHPDLVEPKPGDFDPNQKIECQVVVCDADGRNRAVVTTNRSTAGTWSLGAIDWR